MNLRLASISKIPNLTPKLGKKGRFSTVSMMGRGVIAVRPFANSQNIMKKTSRLLKETYERSEKQQG